VQKVGFNGSFLGLAAIAVVAVCVLFFGVPETLGGARPEKRAAAA
jgi:hypothetical protein